MRRLIVVVPLTLALVACDFRQEQGRVGREAPPPAAVLAPGQDVSLMEQLQLIQAELDMALEGEPSHILTAEAMSDQLLHAPRDVDWLATGYSVEARLRQIQAKADAIVASMRRGSTLAAVEPDIQTLRTAIVDLQRQLQLPGGGEAPPTLETLLAQDPLQDARARVGPPAAGAPAVTPGTTPSPAGRPLGTPVQTPPDDLP
jgi:hypothetical protein